MKMVVLAAVLIAAGPCAPPQPMSASVNVIASSAVRVGELSQLVVKITNTGPLIPHLGLVFRTSDHWYDRHEMTDLSGCVVAAESAGFDCGDLAVNDSRTFSFSGVATAAGKIGRASCRERVQMDG